MKYKPNVSIPFTKNTLLLPEGFDSSELRKHYDKIYETRLEDAIVATLEHFEKLEGESFPIMHVTLTRP